jgi:hypothetical protein
MDQSPQHLARNAARLSHLDLPGAGQVYVAGDYACIVDRYAGFDILEFDR